VPDAPDKAIAGIGLKNRLLHAVFTPRFLTLTIHSYIASASARDLLKGSKPHRFPSSLCAAVALVPGPPSQTPPIPPPAIPSNTVGAPTADSLSPAPAPRSNSSDLAIKKYPPKSACKASKVRSVRPKCNNCKGLSWSDPEFGTEFDPGSGQCPVLSDSRKRPLMI
jgi:hypothetical protein